MTRELADKLDGLPTKFYILYELPLMVLPNPKVIGNGVSERYLVRHKLILDFWSRRAHVLKESLYKGWHEFFPSPEVPVSIHVAWVGIDTSSPMTSFLCVH